MSYLPRRPTGSSSEALFDQWVWDCLARKLRFNGSPTVKVKRTGLGITLEAVAQHSGGSDIEGPFEIQSVQSDYVTVFDYNPANDSNGSTPIYLAKEWKQQNTLEDETIFGVVHAYTYQPGLTPPGGLNPADVNNVFRTDTYGGTVEYQRIVPPWVCGVGVGEIVFAFSADLNLKAADGSAITLMLCGRSCQWAVVNS